ncbi:hypothetical protein OIU77_019600 [Salix suchowensis]|uniref:Auxin response factor n=1 Tax=Salix suchowensis TaxID=1278906 RepID=A0ABQ9CGS4_9ROSI|nr:hypothetical protein OIU77_019600 [Salix suchowensis]
MPQPTELSRVDQRIWRACAGSSVQIPTVNSRVYYFPQGHLEQSSSSTAPHPPSLSNLALSKPLISCQISAVDLLADPVTDEVFIRLLLLPLNNNSCNLPLSFLEPSRREGGGVNEVDDDENKILSFAKILTPSDANNGGGFSVPRFCADSIFPPLNYQAEPPVQTLTVTDIHGISWDFRHIYRGTPRRHLLTTGWSGGSRLLVAVERPKVKVEEGFSRSGRGRLSQEAVAEAVEMAAKGLPFDVVYYPRAGWYSDFVVRAEAVEAALGVFWTAGMRVKMAMETEDSSRMTWFQGTVSGTGLPDSGAWRGSPWRMLQKSALGQTPPLRFFANDIWSVTWDEPEVLQNAKRVSPWQVEFVATTSPLQAAFPPMKKLRYPNDSRFLTDGELFFPMSDLTNSTMGHMNASMLNYSTFPAGMQGARQDSFSTFGLSNFISDTAPQVFSDRAFGNNLVLKMKRMPSEMNIGSLQSENLSPESQSSAYSFDTGFVENKGFNPKKVGINSIQLFGKIIHMDQPVENGFEDVGFMDDSSKCCNETEGVDALELSLSSSYTELLGRIDVQCQRASPVEACST